MICSVDVVINKQNVGVLDKIIELAISLGVTEFDLLHVIPHAWGFDHRDELFYNPREYLPILRKVFRLNRHPGFVVWTNRFPVAFLEGMEDLIQDPHKMYDEVLAIHYGTRRYLDTGTPLDCRQPERCVHCFIEPYCTTMERAVERQNQSTWEVWDVIDDLDALEHLPVPLPFGIHRVGVQVDRLADLDRVLPHLPDGASLYVRATDDDPGPGDLDHLAGRATVLHLPHRAQCERWLSQPLPAHIEEVEVALTHETAPWVLEHRDALVALGDRLRLVQPTYEHLKEAAQWDIQGPRGFFGRLDRPLRVSGLPVCTTPGARVVADRTILPARTVSRDTGRFVIRELAGYHVRYGYRARSSRCEDCVVESRCDGMHINMIRNQGLAQLTPLEQGDEAAQALALLTALHPEPPRRIRHGRAPQPVSPSLFGHATPDSAPRHPLEIIDEARKPERAARRQRALDQLARDT